MLYTRDFDDARKEDKKYAERKALQTAEQINRRIKLFLEDINKDLRLSEGKVEKIKKKLLEDIQL